MSAPELDPVIHAPARLRIMATLNALGEGSSITFPRLQTVAGLTAGNLATHLRRLEEAGYVRIDKSGAGVASRTTVGVTAAGHAALERYSAALRALLGEA